MSHDLRVQPAGGVRVGSAVVLAAAIAVVTAWALRDNAEYLPSGQPELNPLAAGAHAHAGGGYVPPPAILGNALASYAGLGMFALHALVIAVLAVACGLRRWHLRSTVDSGRVLGAVTFAASVALVSALVTAGMAAVLLGTAISVPATLTAALTVLQYSFVLALAASVVSGMP